VSSAKKLLASAGALVASLWASTALPCGAPFGPGMQVDPHQDIIIAHKAGVETYVFQPTFCGKATDFGLVLPVPALLSSAPALGDAKAFEQVTALSQPKVVESTECQGRGGFGADAGVGGGNGGDGTSVVASGRVGFLDWVQLEAKDQASFTAWLDANGYPYDAKAKTAFDYYVAKHWYFVAFKIAQTPPAAGANDCTALGPIRLDFPSATPVVPSRMATAGATVPGPGGYFPGFTWRVFGLTSGAKQIDFANGSWSHKSSFSGALGAGDLAHLDGLAQAGDRLTKLQVWFDGTATEDAVLTLAAPADYRETVYSVTYVNCDDAGTDAPLVDDVGVPGTGAGGSLGVAPGVGGGGCSLPARGSNHGGASAVFGAVVSLGALAFLLRRRANRR
jgi:hypothetical protein